MNSEIFEFRPMDFKVLVDKKFPGEFIEKCQKIDILYYSLNSQRKPTGKLGDVMQAVINLRNDVELDIIGGDFRERIRSKISAFDLETLQYPENFDPDKGMFILKREH